MYLEIFRGRVAAVAVLIAAGLMPVATVAADLAPRYGAMGEMTVELGGETLQLVIPHDKEKDRFYAGQKLVMGTVLTLNIVGRAIGEDGMPGSPMVQVTLQRRAGELHLLSAEMFDEQGFDAPRVMGDDGGDGGLASASFDNDHLEAVVEGHFLRLTGYSKGTPAPAEGAEPEPVTIRWSVDLPALK